MIKKLLLNNQNDTHYIILRNRWTVPTHVIACVGGGVMPLLFITFLTVKLIGVEAGGLGVKTDKSAATLALGTRGVLHASMSYLMQTRDGQVIEPHSISAGLDYPGIGPLHAHLHDCKRVLYSNVTDHEALAANRLMQLEGMD